MADIDPKALRRALGSFMTGVTVVTSRDPETGVPVGFTANSFTSLSLDPPLILVCLGCNANLYSVFERASGFAVNILSAHQREISNRFASPVEDRFAGLHWSSSALNNPLIDDTSAWFDCSFERRFVAGDHMVMIGEVQGFHSSDHPGLGYARGSYFNEQLEKQALDAVSSQGMIRAGAVVEYQGALLLLDQGRTIPSSAPKETALEAMNDLRQRLDGLGITGELGWLYAVQQEGGQQINSMYFHVSAATAPEDFQQDAGLVPMQDIDFSRFNSFERGVLERYVREHARGRFGIYFGSEDTGDVAMR